MAIRKKTAVGNVPAYAAPRVGLPLPQRHTQHIRQPVTPPNKVTAPTHGFGWTHPDNLQ